MEYLLIYFPTNLWIEKDIRIFLNMKDKGYRKNIEKIVTIYGKPFQNNQDIYNVFSSTVGSIIIFLSLVRYI